MRKAVWSAISAAAMVLAFSTSAFAQLDTETINATAVVAARGRITLTGVINFPDTDPFTNPTINAAPLSVQALARVAVGAGVSLTVQAGGDFISGTDSIAIGNLSWASAGAGYTAAGTMSSAAAQSVGGWTGPGARNGTQTYTLVNDWNYAPGNYSVTLTYTLTTP
ncbi:MAG TPA: hypothetical protein VH740_09200 [Vicinamibacterales bacterium]